MAKNLEDIIEEIINPTILKIYSKEELIKKIRESVFEELKETAINAHVNYAWSGLSFGGFDWSKTGLDLGDKCKLIILKEEKSSENG